MVGRLTPQERFRLAKDLRKRALAPGLTPAERAENWRHARNLLTINMVQAVHTLKAKPGNDPKP
jgi:hypothetical protein